MATRLSLDPLDPDPQGVDLAVSHLHSGDLVIVPTETVYGVAADPTAEGAVEKIYQAKLRARGKAIAYLIGNEETARKDGARLSPCAQRLADRYWPGPLTMVLPVADGERGYRVPDHGVTLALLIAFGRPLAVTSANLSGSPPARTADEAEATLGDKVACILDSGPSPGGVHSSVVRVTGIRTEVIREGAISTKALEACMG